MLTPATLLAAEQARREHLLSDELRGVEEGAAADHAANLSEIVALNDQMHGVRQQMLAVEVERCNEQSQAHARARADSEVANEQRRLEATVLRTRREKEAAEEELGAMREELEYMKLAKAVAEKKAAAEREAHARWQSHNDETLAHTRHRLVARTEQVLQLGLQLEQAAAMPAAIVDAPAGSTHSSSTAGSTTAGEGTSASAIVATISAALREEREARLCAVCLQAERTTVLMPCRHAVLCASCATTVRATSGRCPLCRQGVTEVVRTFG